MIGVQAEKSLPQRFEMPPVQMRVERLGMALRDALRVAWQRVRETQLAMRARSERRSLRVAESVSLGDKRAVYLIEVDGHRLLLGASAAGVTLLSQLPPPKEAWQSAVKDLVFADVMEGCETAKPARRKTASRKTAGETI